MTIREIIESLTVLRKSQSVFSKEIIALREAIQILEKVESQTIALTGDEAAAMRYLVSAFPWAHYIIRNEKIRGNEQLWVAEGRPVLENMLFEFNAVECKPVPGNTAWIFNKEGHDMPIKQELFPCVKANHAYEICVDEDGTVWLYELKEEAGET